MNTELERLVNNSSKGKKGQYVKDAYFYSIEKSINALLKHRIFSVTKFLPSGWDNYSPTTNNSVCHLIMECIINPPSNIYLPVYWQDVLVPHINITFVNLRCNLNQRIKSQYMLKYKMFILKINYCYVIVINNVLTLYENRRLNI
jgi:hypothetical protein